MIISHQKKFIFVHTYKTAGTTIESELLQYSRYRERLISTVYLKYFIYLINQIFDSGKNGNKWISGVPKHASASEMCEYIGEDKFNEYFKFSFVRNPFDWLVSLYSYMYSQKMEFGDFLKKVERDNYPTQSSFLLIDNEIAMDYVGKVESIDYDFQKIRERIGLLNNNVDRLPIANASVRKDAMSYYSNDQKEFVVNFFNDDFVNFGYRKDIEW